MQYPEYYHIGLMKTGTTTIQEILEQDNRIGFNLFTRDIHTQDYHLIEEGISDKENRILVESYENILRGYFGLVGLPISIKRIQEMRPDAKIILTIREQRSHLISAYKHFIRQADKHLSFKEFIKTDAGISHYKTLDYSANHDILTNYFPEENINYIPYELLKEDFWSFVQAFYSCFNISPPKDIQFKKRNISKPDHYIIFKNKLHKYLVFRDGITLHNFEVYIQKLILNIYERISSNTSKKTIFWPANDTFFKSLEEEFRKSNKQFFKQINQDFSHYNYLI